jgi:hypothetical protein
MLIELNIFFIYSNVSFKFKATYVLFKIKNNFIILIYIYYLFQRTVVGKLIGGLCAISGIILLGN